MKKLEGNLQLYSGNFGVQEYEDAHARTRAGMGAP